MRAGIVLFEEVDLLDVGGPYEVLLTASRLVERDGDAPPFTVVTVGPGPVRAYGGVGLVPQVAPGDAGPLDVLVVPGAVAIDRVRADEALLAWLRPLAEATPLVASVCTGAFLLADLGILPSTWTTHWEDVDALGAITGTSGDPTVRWVDTGAVVTSGGLSSGIAMALHLVARVAGESLAVRTARQLDYVWDPAGART